MEERNPASGRRRDSPDKEKTIFDTPQGRANRSAGRFRILVANEPRSYREAISGTLQTLRPDFEVLVMDPHSLDAEVNLASPDMVVCSYVTPAVREKVPVWVELYPEGRSLTTISTGGNPSTTGEMRLTELLMIIDRAAGSVRTG